MPRIVKVSKTREDKFTISIDSVFLHSKYYPSKEAETFIQSNIDKIKNKKYIVIYGIGLGYHLKKLLKLIDNDCKVFAFDCDVEVIKKSKELGALNELKNDKRIKLFYGYNSIFLKKLAEKMNLVEDIIIYKPSLRTIPLEYQDLTNILNSYELSKIAIDRFGDMAIENYKINLSSNHKSIGEFLNEKKICDKPVVIVAGGPSLELNLPNLKKHRNKIYIFALGRTIDILVKNEIIPDMITIIDPQKIVYEQIKDHVNLDIPLCFLSTASNEAVSNYNGPKYIFFNDLNENNKDNIVINTGKSVAIAALDIAIKCGTRKIIFVGQDLAFLNNKFHAGEELIDKKFTNKGLKKVEGVEGKFLDTTVGMLEFKRNIENIIVSNKEVIFINCSKGARIEGTNEIEFEEVFS